MPEKGLLLYQKNITFEAYGRACREFLIDGFKEKEISSTFESLNIHKGISIFHKG